VWHLYSKGLILILRPYQQKALDELEACIAFGSTNLVLDATTSFGKTAMMAGICQLYDDKHIVIMTNIEPLINQIADTLRKMKISYSILKAGREKEFKPDARINIIMSQTYYARADKGTHDIKADILIIDERHREYNTPRTKKLITDLEPEVIIGLTGTPYDSKGFALHEAEIISTTTSQELTDQGFLSPLKFYVPRWAERVNYSKVKKSGNDFSMASLDEIIGTPTHIDHIVKSMNDLNAKNKKTLVFSSTIEMCDKLEDALKTDGYSVAAYHSKKSKKENERIMHSFKNNIEFTGSDQELDNKTLFDESHEPAAPIKCIVSVSKLNIGFSVEDIDLGVIVRKIGPRSLFVQSAGRLKRKYTGLTDLINKHKDDL